jgi:[ribosomal protein S5]-alanine N-acetyltransferase
MTLPLDYTIVTKRCRLRRPSLADIPHIFSAARAPGFNDGMLWEPPESEADLVEPYEESIRAWESSSAFTFSIESSESNHFIGRISIRKQADDRIWNLGFWTHPRHQGRGYMTESVGAILEFGFTQLGAVRITACYATWNRASKRVLERNGMSVEQHIPEGFLKNGKWIPEELAAIHYDDWRARP